MDLPLSSINSLPAKPGLWSNIWNTVKKAPQEVWNRVADAAQLSFHKPFPNTYQQAFKDKVPDKMGIFFTGAAQSGADVFKDSFKHYKMPYQFFRHIDKDKAAQLIADLKRKYPKLKFHIFGHSMGTRASAELGKKFPWATVDLIDPVYPFGASYPKNLGKNIRNYQAKDTSIFQKAPSQAWGNLVALVGGRRSGSDLGVLSDNRYQMPNATHVSVDPYFRYMLQEYSKEK